MWQSIIWLRLCLNARRFALSAALLPVALGGVHGILGFSGVCCSRSTVRVVSGVLFVVVDCVDGSEGGSEEQEEGVRGSKSKTKSGVDCVKLKG